MRAVFVILLLWTGAARAEIQHQLLRRIAVFPIQEQGVGNSEEAWWQMREQLTKDQRFLVASRRFMINRGVFQPRRNFKASDAIILGKILDAQALVTSSIDERTFTVKVYDGENGYLMWEGSLEFHPAQAMSDQVVNAAQKLIQDFIIDLPYQGFIVVDPIKSNAMFEEGGKKRSWIYHGNTKVLDVGDEFELIEFTGETSKPYFKHGRTTVVAQGKIVEVQSDRVLVDFDHIRDLKDIRENALVRFPKESKRLADLYTHTVKETGLGSEYLTSEMRPADQIDKRHDSSVTSLAFILNMAAMILLAF